MNSAQTLPAIMIVLLGFTAVATVAIRFWSGTLKSATHYLNLGALSIQSILIALGWVAWAKEEYQPIQTVVGWIGHRDELQAITVGATIDPLGLSISTLLLILTWIIYINADALTLSETKASANDAAGRIRNASCIASAGGMISWLAFTPWISFIGLALVFLAGLVAMGVYTQGEPDSGTTARFLWERSGGLTLAAIGVCILSVGHPGMLLNSSQALELNRDRLGAILLLIGVLTQFQPFPILGSLVRSGTSPQLFQPFFLQLLPALGAAPLFYRLEEGLRSDLSFKAVGALAIASSFLSSLCGLFQRNWRAGLACWISSGLTLSMGAVAFSDPKSGLFMMVGTLVGSTAMLFSFASLEARGKTGPAAQSKATWAKTLLFLGTCIATGFIGSVSAGSGATWLASDIERPLILLLSGLGLVLWAFSGWRLAWKAAQTSTACEVPWRWVLLPLFFQVFGTGLAWDGTLTGGALPNRVDRIFDSLSSLLFVARSENRSWGDDLVTMTAVFFGGLLLTVGLTYWLSKRSSEREDRWETIRDRFPRVCALIASGYGTERFFGFLLSGTAKLGRASQVLIDEVFWARLVPTFATKTLGTLGAASAESDERQSIRPRWLAQVVDVPGKVLQMIQNGDVRWYILFATGMSISILVHFLLATRG